LEEKVTRVKVEDLREIRESGTLERAGRESWKGIERNRRNYIKECLGV